VLASAVGLAVGRSPSALEGVFVDVNVLALHPLLAWFGGIEVGAITLIGLAAIAVVVLLARWRGVAAVAVPLVLVCVASASFSANRLSQESKGRTAERVILGVVHRISTRFGATPSCIGYDIPMEHVWHLANDQFFLPNVKFHRFNSSTAGRPCGDLAISGRWDLATQYPGAGLITPENFAPTKLWVMPGHLHDQLQQAGMILPPNFPSALPASAYKSTIKLVGIGPGTKVLPYNGERDLILSVTHDGTGSPWPDRSGFTSGDGWVRLAVIWVAQSNPLVPVGQDSVDLPRTVFPGDTVRVTLPLTPRDLNGRSLPPGNYVVRVGLVQDGFTYFTDKGDQTLDLGVTVGRPAGHA
jgi:hypothetical protein